MQQNPWQSEEFTLKTADDIEAASIDMSAYPNFVGWSTTEFPYQTTEPTLAVATAQVTAATNYYAVFTNLESVQIVPDDFNGTKANNEGEKTYDGIKYNVHDMCKQSSQIQFSSGGYLYTKDAIKYISKVEITGLDLPVYACSNNSGSVDGSAITPAGTAPYVYTFPANKQYLKITDKSGTSKVSLIKIYYASEAVYYTTQFSTLTFKKADGTDDKSEKVATNKPRTLVEGDAPTAVTGYDFLNKWSDGSIDYEVGEAVTVSSNMALTPYSKLTTQEDVVDIDGLPDGVVDIVVANNKELNVNDDKTIDNLTIEEGGKVSGSNALTVNNLTIQTSLGTISGENGNANGSCGQIMNPANVTANGDIFIEINLTGGVPASYGWYAFSVPFEVDALNGVYYQDTKLTNEVGYAIMKYHEDIRATGKYAWKKYRDIMRPGELYTITVAKTEYGTLRFKKHGNAALANTNSIAVSKTSASDQGTNLDEGWNGLGNPNLQVSYTNAESYMHFLDHDANAFKTREAGKVNLVVGSAFFIQYSGSEESIALTIGSREGDDNLFLAPAREARAIENTIHEVKIFNGDKEEDNIFFTAREEATNSYQAGRDVAKMSMGAAKCAQMMIPAYGTNLCAADFPLINDKAEYPLTITTPAAGLYRLEVAEAYADADIYLTKDGAIIWNLTMSPYEAELVKGQNSGYGLLLQTKMPQTPTGIEEANGEELKANVQKVIINDHVYILRGGQMYDVTGKMVR